MTVTRAQDGERLIVIHNGSNEALLNTFTVSDADALDGIEVAYDLVVSSSDVPTSWQTGDVVGDAQPAGAWRVTARTPVLGPDGPWPDVSGWRWLIRRITTAVEAPVALVGIVLIPAP